MKIQELAIIFVIIILPISLLISVYTQMQIQTINLQTEYDARLTSATYDAINAFQLNSANSTTSDISNSKIRDLEASVTTFRNSIKSAFELNGYTEEDLNNYIPALVYTLYDGFYIYSPYNNVNYKYEEDGTPIDDNGENLYGLKPYITYSARYKKGNINVVITYALDNCITVQGMMPDPDDGNKVKYVNKSGYLIEDITYEKTEDETDYTIEYNGVPILTEQLKEFLPIRNDDTRYTEFKDIMYPYIKLNGTKYYDLGEGTNGGIVSISNGTLKWQCKPEGEDKAVYEIYKGLIEKNNSAKEYYKKAFEFTNWFKNSGLTELKYSDAYDEVINGEKIESKQIWDDSNDQLYNTKIFQFGGSKNIENELSTFNQHRLAIIRHKIETNLAIAISNYNEYSGENLNTFQMPKLKEDEWDNITHNISLISFLQGLPIGGKIYNGYTLVTNSESKEVVIEDSIYMLGEDNYYHKVGDKELEEESIKLSIGYTSGYSSESKFKTRSAGRLNLDFERNLINSGDSSYYYYPLRKYNASYNSIVMQNKVTTYDDIYEYVNERNDDYKQAFYTALGRERETKYVDHSGSSLYQNYFNGQVCEITLDANGGTFGESESDNMIIISAILNSPYGEILEHHLPERYKYRFIGWYTEAEGGEKVETGTICTGNTTLYAHWEYVEYKLTFELGDGNEYVVDKIYAGDKIPEIPGVVIPNGKVFYNEWKYEDHVRTVKEGTEFIPPNNSDKEYRLIPIFEPGYTVRFDLNGGNGDIPDKIISEYGENITLPKSEEVTKDGYILAGWSKNKDAKQPEYLPGDTCFCDDNVTFYAIWGYTITYDANEGEGAPEPQMKIHGETLTLSSIVPTRSGYVFGGWSTDKNATTATYVAGGEYTENASATLYAVWELEYIDPEDIFVPTPNPTDMTKLNIGDWINYEAPTVPNSNFGNISGWRLFDITDSGEMVLISVGVETKECLGNGNSTTSKNYINDRYVKKGAISSEILTVPKLTKWYQRYISSSVNNLDTNKQLRLIYDADSNPDDPTSIDNKYWRYTSIVDSRQSYYMGLGSGIYFDHFRGLIAGGHYDGDYGNYGNPRILVTLDADVLISANPVGTVETPETNYNITNGWSYEENIGPFTYNVWNIKAPNTVKLNYKVGPSANEVYSQSSGQITVATSANYNIAPTQIEAIFEAGNAYAQLSSETKFTLQGYNGSSWVNIVEKSGNRPTNKEAQTIFNGTIQLDGKTTYTKFRVLFRSTDNERYVYCNVTIK